VYGQRVLTFNTLVKFCFQRVLIYFVFNDMELKIYDKFETRRGNLYYVIIDGCKFRKSKEMKDENIYFRCTDHNCKSSAIICKYIEQIIILIIMSTIIHLFQTV